jgi:protein-L-isoaspartate O-methyltransferase
VPLADTHRTIDHISGGSGYDLAVLRELVAWRDGRNG